MPLILHCFIYYDKRCYLLAPGGVVFRTLRARRLRSAPDATDDFANITLSLRLLAMIF